jgi:hypothetical protein
MLGVVAEVAEVAVERCRGVHGRRQRSCV